MKQINELSMMINQHFNWNKARMNCFIGMLVALLSTRSINLTEVAMAFPSPAKLDSRYRRIQRFITEYSPNFDKVAWFIMGLFNFIASDYYLTMDRTNWRWGKKDINILVLAVAYKGAAIPIYWMLLNKKGNSSTLEREVLVNRFIKQFGKKHILGLLADREFIGKKWFEWLKAQEIDFVIRIKKDAKTTNSQGQKLQVQHLFRFLKVGEKQSIQDLRMITDAGVYLTALRLDNGELLILASSKKTEQAIESYKERWQIETLFSCLKGRGFNLEDTHVTQRLRIKRLLIVPVIAFCWAHRIGEWQHEKVKEIKVKKHERLAKSIFRVGLDLLRDTLFKRVHSFDCSLKPFFQFIDFNKLYAKC
jgi:hypothetical protein